MGLVDLNVNPDDMDFGADEIVRILIQYDNEIDAVNRVVRDKLSMCRGELYDEFKQMYEISFLRPLEEGKKRLLNKAKELGIDANLFRGSAEVVRDAIHQLM